MSTNLLIRGEHNSSSSKKIASIFVIYALLGWTTSIMAEYLKCSVFINYAIPYFIFSIYRCRLKTSMFLIVSLGIIQDLWSGYSHVGIHYLAYLLTFIFVYPRRNYFIYHTYYTIGIIAAIFSFLSSIIHIFGYGLFEANFSFIKFAIIGDLFLHCSTDAIYTSVLFYIADLIFPVSNARSL